MADTEKNPDAIRVQLEKDACEKSSQGDLLGAIKDIDGAIAVDQRWYHYLYKALWFVRLQNLDMTYATLQAGLGHFQDKEFWFRLYYAEIIYGRPFPLNTIEQVKNRIRELDNAIIAAERAHKRIEADKLGTVEKDISEIPDCFTISGHMNLNLTNLKFVNSGLLNDLKMAKSGLMTLNAIYAVDANINTKVTKLESKFETEKIKTIELLGIFTAIISFVIITGTSALRMGSFEVAMPILGGLALVLLVLVSAVSLFTTRYISFQDRIFDIKLWVLVFLVITIGGLICYSVNKTAEQNVALNNKISTNGQLTKEEWLEVYITHEIKQFTDLYAQRIAVRVAIVSKTKEIVITLTSANEQEEMSQTAKKIYADEVEKIVKPILKKYEWAQNYKLTVQYI